MSYILVTGCNGFIGSKITLALLKEGYHVLGISTGKKQIVHPNFKYYSMNITNCLAVEKIFEQYNVSTVIHLAAIAHKKKRQKIDWNTYYRINSLASKTIFKCAARAKADIIFASTVDVYGAAQEEVLTTDITPKPVSNYGYSKHLAEIFLMQIGKESSIKYIILRFAPVYCLENMKDVYKRIYVKEPNIAFIIGKGLKYEFLSINNIINFISSWIESENKVQGVLNLTDKELIDTKMLIQKEKCKNKARLVIWIPEFIIKAIKKIIIYLCKVTKSSKLLYLRTSLYKIINPPRY